MGSHLAGGSSPSGRRPGVLAERQTTGSFGACQCKNLRPGSQQRLAPYQAFLALLMRSAIWPMSCYLYGGRTAYAPATRPRQRERCAEMRASANPSRSGGASTSPSDFGGRTRSRTSRTNGPLTEPIADSSRVLGPEAGVALYLGVGPVGEPEVRGADQATTRHHRADSERGGSDGGCKLKRLDLQSVSTAPPRTRPRLT